MNDVDPQGASDLYDPDRAPGRAAANPDPAGRRCPTAARRPAVAS